MWTPLAAAEALPRLEAAAEAFTAILAAGDLAAAVPTCPGWDLRTLAHHLGNVHRWARGAIVEGHPDTGEIDAPSGQPELADWYRACAARLLATLREVGPDHACWTFGPKPRTASFWFRRQLHETTMHLQDAALAGDGPTPALELVVALDGIDEVVRMFFPRQVRLGRIAPLGRALALVPTDRAPHAVGLRWVLAGDGADPAGGPASPVDVEAGGPAEVLLALLWHRADPDDARLTVTGDPAALLDVHAVALTP
jgi:uncharacterized protein (TIGR03083 family)